MEALHQELSYQYSCFSPTSMLVTLPRKGKSHSHTFQSMTASELSKNHIWLRGPDWLCTSQELPDEEMDNDTEVLEECSQEIKSKKAAHSLVIAQSHGPCIEQLMSCESFSSLHRLLRVPALVLKFVHLLHLKVRKLSECTPTECLSEIDQARVYWLRYAQSQLQQDSKFPLWKYQFNQYVDKFQMWRSDGRMSQIFCCQLKLYEVSCQTVLTILPHRSGFGAQSECSYSAPKQESKTSEII